LFKDAISPANGGYRSVCKRESRLNQAFALLGDTQFLDILTRSLLGIASAH